MASGALNGGKEKCNMACYFNIPFCPLPLSSLSTFYIIPSSTSHLMMWPSGLNTQIQQFQVMILFFQSISHLDAEPSSYNLFNHPFNVWKSLAFTLLILILVQCYSIQQYHIKPIAFFACGNTNKHAAIKVTFIFLYSFLQHDFLW